MLQDALVDELKKILSSMMLKNTNGEMTKINVIPQNLPYTEQTEQIEEGETYTDDIDIMKATEDIEQSEESSYPYVLVMLDNGKVSLNTFESETEVNLVFGIYDDSNNAQGHRDIVNMITKIVQHFSKYPLVGKKYEIQDEITWALSEEKTFPLYFGGMSLKFKGKEIRREDQYS